MKRFFLVLLLIIAAEATAFAQSEPTPVPVDIDSECTTDADCPDGFTCQVLEVGACPDCAEGQDCPPCTSDSFSYCEPPPPEQCDADSDCASGEVCVTYEYQECSGGGSTAPPCDPDEQNCIDIAPEPQPEPTCTSGSESYCVPQYVAPCDVDADCGGGFTCQDIEICSCTTDADGPRMGTGTDGAPVEPGSDIEPGGCECAPSGDKYCELIQVACDDDSDCAQDLTCESFGGGEVPVTTDVCDDGPPCESQPVDPMPEPPTESYCAPQGYYGWAESGDYGGTDRIARATGQENVSAGDRISWGDDSSGSKSDSGGCSSTGGNVPGSALVLMLLGMVGLMRRKRA